VEMSWGGSWKVRGVSVLRVENARRKWRALGWGGGGGAGKKKREEAEGHIAKTARKGTG